MKGEDLLSPLIFDIRRCSMDDGPGIRTVIFFKGCPLNCIWCHNPESISPMKQLAFYHDKCIGCRECEKACRFEAIIAGHGILREKCKDCGKCEEVCPALAVRNIGKRYSIDELLDMIMVDKKFYRTSGGGITLSGGEPTLYMDYTGKILRRLKELGIHTAIQTCGYFNLSEFYEKIFPFVDLIFYDIKLIDRELHIRYTGKDNRVILDNFMHIIGLKEKDKSIISRTPIIPGITDTRENLFSIKELVENLGLKDHVFLPYNPLGITKRLNIGMEISSELKDLNKVGDKFE